MSVHLLSHEEKELFCESYERACCSTRFYKRFYEIFIGSNKEVAEKFKNTDFNKQERMLRLSLNMLITVSSRDVPEIKVHLERIAKTHSKSEMDIRPELYGLWMNTLINTLEEFDKKFDTKLERIWRRVLSFGITYMVQRYDSTQETDAEAMASL